MIIDPKDRDRAVEIFADLDLVEITDPTAKVRCFYLCKPGTRMGSLLLTFTPEGIALQGDMAQREWRPTRTRGLTWFLGRPKGRYLWCEFVEEQHIADAARAELLDEAARIESDHPEDRAMALRMRELAREIDETDPRWTSDLHDALGDIGYDLADGLPGFTYPSWECALLEAVVDRFCDLFEAQAKEAA